MDSNRSNLLSTLVPRARNRRGVVRALLALAAGGLTPALVGAKKKSCGPCRRQKRGRCRGAKPDATPCGECGICLDGVCTPAKADCGGPCMECGPTARCRAKPDGATCLDNGTCLNGLCNQPL